MSTLLCTMMIFGISGCKTTKVVGKDIKFDDINDFYFTYSSSTNPPEFQRYRFYKEDDRYYYYHETREGDHWPLTEADITVSGIKELSKEETDRFFEYLKNGTVKAREESTDSGDSGPWMYLYWKNDKGKYQEFSFASYDIQRAYENYCISLKEN